MSNYRDARVKLIQSSCLTAYIYSKTIHPHAYQLHCAMAHAQCVHSTLSSQISNACNAKILYVIDSWQPNSITNCTTCFYGFYLSKGICMKCRQGCSSWENQDNCLTYSNTGELCCLWVYLYPVWEMCRLVPQCDFTLYTVRVKMRFKI